MEVSIFRIKCLRPEFWTAGPAAALVVAGCSLAGCSGVIDDGLGTSSIAADSLCESTRSGVPYAPMRRLSRVEYQNTVHDLVGVAVDANAELEADESLGGFHANAVTPITRRAIGLYADLANQVATDAGLDRLVGCDVQAEGEAQCAERFIRDFGRRAFRRTLSDDEVADMTELFEAKRTRDGFEAAVRLSAEAFLQAPSFLYRPELSTATAQQPTLLDGFEIATRLSYFLWSSTPDAELLDAAEAGALATRTGIREQTLRMLNDERSLAALDNFHNQWLHIDRLSNIDKDRTLYPEASPELFAAMQRETAMFARSVFVEGAPFETLLTASYTYIDPVLASLYGIETPTNIDAATGMARVELPPEQRSGILTHASFLSAQANAGQSSPILRGKFVRERMLCQIIPLPPSDVDVTPPAADPSLSTRERFKAHTEDATCAGCHRLMDPIGFGLEHFDAIGRYREKDGQHDIDASGSLFGTEDVDGDFDGAGGLSERLAQSAEVRRCYGKQWLRFGLGRKEGVSDRCTVESLSEQLASGAGLNDLLMSVVTSDAFRYGQGGEQ